MTFRSDMETTTCHVLRVAKGHTRVPGLHQYVIDTDGLGLQLQTVDAWKASLCDIARAKGQLVKVGWVVTNYGKTLRTVKLLENIA